MMTTLGSYLWFLGGWGAELAGILVILSASFMLGIFKFQQNSSRHMVSVFHRKVF